MTLIPSLRPICSKKEWSLGLGLVVVCVLLLIPSSTEAMALDKRAPFSSWAGKRSDHQADAAQLLHDLNELYMMQGGNDYEEVAPIHSAKRAPFSSWAGKRAPFSSWAGKRAPFSSWAGKRAPFSSWAGKRSAWPAQMEEEERPDEKLRYKRSSEEEADDVMDVRQRRGANSFSAWGGKRAKLRRFTRNVPIEGLVPVRVLRPQRAAFSAWGG